MEEPPPFRTLAPGLRISPQVEAVVMKSLTKDRDQRHASVLDFARELAAAAQPTSAPEVRKPLPSAKIIRPLEEPSPDIVRATKVNPKDGLKYVWIPPGTFMMGCSPGDTECFDDEKPPHKVTITKGFWLGQTEVTVGAYKRFALATGRQMPPEPNFNGRPLNPWWGNEAMPIVEATWDDAQAYCSWAGGRLPTEAEWEYAARAGSTAARYGDLDEIAWYADNSGRERLDSAKLALDEIAWCADNSGRERLDTAKLAKEIATFQYRLYENGNGMHEVGQKRANGFGLYDMLGNVWEWVNDWHDGRYYKSSPSQDPAGPTSGHERVIRGGSWNLDSRFIRVSERDWYVPGDGDSLNGFRCGGEVFAP
jgi:formylglycine-generating enzyme required for sulfatase activity